VLLDHLTDNMNCRIVKRDSNGIIISIRGQEESYEYIKINEFSSARKMMSVVVKSAATGEETNYAKGADSMIKSKLSRFETEELELYNVVETLAAEQALRTLIFAAKPAKLGEDDPEIEYYMLGYTAVEDLLQVNVKETLTTFIDAGINVWMLTGDKGATAKQIGKNSGLLRG
jgi:phospholipid-translocating ATPase